MKTIFEYEYYKTKEEIIEQVKKCEGKHIQQCAYSTFQDVHPKQI